MVRSFQPFLIKRSVLHTLLITLGMWMLACFSLSLPLWVESIDIGFSIFLALYMIILWIAFLARPGKGKFDLLELYWVFIGVYSIYAWSAAFYAELREGATYVGVIVSPEARQVYYLSINVGLAGFILGYQLLARYLRPGARSLASSLNRVHRDRFADYVLWAAIFFTLLTLPGLVNSLRVGGLPAYGATTDEMRLMQQENINSGIAGFIGDIPRVLLISAMFLRLRKGKIWKFLLPIYLLWSTFASLSQGGRGILIDYAFLLLLLIHYRVRQIRLSSLLIAAIPLYLILVTIQHVRVTSDLQLMVKRATALVSANPKLLLPTSVGEFVAPSGNLLILIDGIERGTSHFTWGYSVLTELATWIPRPLFPGRPLPQAYLYTEIFLPGLFYTGHGAGFFLPMEGYWALGIPGIFLEMLFFGSVAGLVYYVFRQNKDNDATFLLYVLIFPALAIMSVRGGMLGTFKYALMICAPLVVLLFLSFLTQRNAKPRHLISSPHEP